jgi:hypothetical protein
MPGITDEVIHGLEVAGDVNQLPHTDRLRELMSTVRFIGSDVPVFEGCGVIFTFQKDGPMYHLTMPGHILEQTSEVDGNQVLDFPGGLYDYAINKALSVAALKQLGSNSGLSRDDDAAYIQETTKAGSVHMGGATYTTEDGRTFFTGVSGAEMTAEAVERIKAMIPEDSQAGQYTIAGAIDEVVAGWVNRLAAGEDITLDQAQDELNRVLDYVLVETRTGGKVPDQFH